MSHVIQSEECAQAVDTHQGSKPCACVHRRQGRRGDGSSGTAQGMHVLAQPFPNIIGHERQRLHVQEASTQGHALS